MSNFAKFFWVILILCFGFLGLISTACGTIYLISTMPNFWMPGYSGDGWSFWISLASLGAIFLGVVVVRYATSLFDNDSFWK